MAGYYLFVFAVIWCCGGFAILDSSLRDLKKIKKGHLLSSMASFIFKFAFALYFLGMHWMVAGHDYFDLEIQYDEGWQYIRIEVWDRVLH